MITLFNSSSNTQNVFVWFFFTFEGQQYEELRSSKMQKESLLEKLHSAEQRCKESEVISVAALSRV